MHIFVITTRTYPEIELFVKFVRRQVGMVRCNSPSTRESTGPMITSQVPSSARRLTPSLAVPESRTCAPDVFHCCLVPIYIFSFFSYDILTAKDLRYLQKTVRERAVAQYYNFQYFQIGGSNSWNNLFYFGLPRLPFFD